MECKSVFSSLRVSIAFNQRGTTLTVRFVGCRLFFGDPLWVLQKLNVNAEP